jgi:hypothetical protein
MTLWKSVAWPFVTAWQVVSFIWDEDARFRYKTKKGKP